MTEPDRQQRGRSSSGSVGCSCGADTIPGSIHAPQCDDNDEEVCVDDYPEHDYRVMDERDGVRTLICSRCGAETWEDDDA